MLHLLFSILFLALPLFAQFNYSLCSKKLKDSHAKENNLALSVSNNLRLYFKTPPKDASIIKSNPFLSLYLVREKDSFAYPFELTKSSQNLVLLEKDSYQKIQIMQNQIGLDHLGYAKTKKIIAPIVSKCCKVYGVNTPSGIIEYPYLKRFLKDKDTVYSDIGIRVKDKNRQIIIVAIDPFHKKGLKRGDIILSFDGHEVKSSASLMQDILFSTINSSHTLKIKRIGIVKTLKLQTYKRFGGGFISDTFLEQKGIYLRDGLEIDHLSDNAKKYSLKNGDKILQVNGYDVKTEEDIRHFISEYKDFVMLLIQRDGFQFFVKII